ASVCVRTPRSHSLRAVDRARLRTTTARQSGPAPPTPPQTPRRRPAPPAPRPPPTPRARPHRHHKGHPMIDRLQSHYGFTRPPFSKLLTPAQLHQHAGHSQAVARLTWCISARAIGLLCGESGAGKTVAARATIAALDPTPH